MELNLKYGSQKIKCMVPDSTDVLKVDEPFFNIVKKEFEDTLLKLIPSDREKIAVIISDKTRLCGYDKYLPWLLNVLKLKGYKKSNITFYIAYGTHPKQTDKECYNCYGPIKNISSYTIMTVIRILWPIWQKHPLVHLCTLERIFWNLICLLLLELYLYIILQVMGEEENYYSRVWQKENLYILITNYF